MYLKIDSKIGIQYFKFFKKGNVVNNKLLVFFCPTGFNIYHIIISQTSAIMQTKANNYAR